MDESVSVIFSLPLVKQHVEKVQSLIDKQLPPVGKLTKFPTSLETLPDLISTGREMIESADRPHAEQGLNLLEAIKKILDECDAQSTSL